MDDRDCGLTDKLFRLFRALGTGLVRTGNLREKMAEGSPIGVSIKFSMVSTPSKLLQQYYNPKSRLTAKSTLLVSAFSLKLLPLASLNRVLIR